MAADARTLRLPRVLNDDSARLRFLALGACVFAAIAQGQEVPAPAGEGGVGRGPGRCRLACGPSAARALQGAAAMRVAFAADQSNMRSSLALPCIWRRSAR